MKSTHCLCFTVLTFGVGACVNRVPIEGMPCPCVDGYTCCDNQCLPGQACQLDAGSTSDVAIESTTPVWTDAGQSRWQPIASWSHSDWISLTTTSPPFVMGDRAAFRDMSPTGRAVTYRFAENNWLEQEGHWPTDRDIVRVGLVWTGSQAVYWGGVASGGEFFGECNNRGGVYSPATDTWSAINTTGAPLLAVDGGGYTGKEVVLRGDSCVPQQSGSAVPGPVIGVLYNPATDAWRSMSTVNAPTTAGGTDVVLGEKVVCWGGALYVAGQAFTGPLYQSSGLTNSGAVYNAADDTWTAMSTTNAPSPRFGVLALAMRGRMFVWGGTDGTTNSFGEQSYFRDGGIFDPETNTWTSISKDDSPILTADNGLLWAEEQGLVYLWASIWKPDVGWRGATLWTYDPSADQWASVDVTGLPEMLSTYFVWTGKDLLAIGMLAAEPTTIMGGFRYTP